MNTYSHYSYRKRDIEHLLRLTDFFTWEELPTRDRDTGYLTSAGYISIIQRLYKYIIVFGLGYHLIQSTVRIVISHDMIFTKWFPIDASSSPVYEIVNLIQVMFTFLKRLNFYLTNDYRIGYISGVSNWDNRIFNTLNSQNISTAPIILCNIRWWNIHISEKYI